MCRGCGLNPARSIRCSLNLTGLPLYAGIATILAGSLAILASQTPGWMTGVTSALESEETASLARLSKAQAAYSNEIMGQMVVEVDAMTRFATDVWVAAMDPAYNGSALDPAYPFSSVAGAAAVDATSTSTHATETLPAGTYIWGWPFSSVANVLEVGTQPPSARSPGDIVPENSVCTPQFGTSCWTEPAGARTASGAQLETLRDGTRGSRKTSSVEWPPSLGTDVTALPAELLEDIRVSAYLEDVFAEVYASNPTGVAIYVGTERTGVMRQYPYKHKVTGVALTRYTAASTPPFSTTGGAEYWGYDPRNRPWYQEAKYYRKLIVSAPYVYSTPPYPVGITIAKPIYHPTTGELFGVIGFDVTVDLLESVIVSSSILYNGYAYLVNDQGRAVVYPCSTLGAGSRSACEERNCLWDATRAKCTTPDKDSAGNLLCYTDFEFRYEDQGGRNWPGWQGGPGPCTAAAAAPSARVLNSGSAVYSKRETDGGGAKKWHIAWAPVPTASYTLALVVPDADIQVPATRARETMQLSIFIQVLVYVLVALLGTAMFVMILNRVTRAVVKPVVGLKRIIDMIISDLARKQEEAAASETAFKLNVREEIDEKDELCKEVSMMKDSFEYMVQALRFGSSAFAKNDLDGARKVYQDALTMYQALNNKKGEGIATFNLGATEHRRWLKEDKLLDGVFETAKAHYLRSIDIARAQWKEITEQRVADTTTITITPAASGASKGPAPATVAGVRVGTVGHDIANRLSGRLYQLAQLLMDCGTVQTAQIAEPLIVEALALDTQTNNVLGYASRLGLLCKVLILLGKWPEANQRVSDQLEILRARVVQQERVQAMEERSGANKADIERANSLNMQREQEREELIEALQHVLKDAAIVQGATGLGDDHLALRYFIEALSCAPRSPPHVLSSILRELSSLLERHAGDGSFPPHLHALVADELSNRRVTTTPKDLVFVVDYSGSMSGSKMRRAREGIQDIISSRLEPEDRSSIIIFAEGVQQVTQGLLGAQDPKLMQAVSSLQKPQGGTALWDGIGAALAQLHHGSSRGRDDWIICVTDGEDNRSRQHAPQQLQQMIHQMGTNVIILSVGVTKPTAHVDMATVVGNAASGCIGEKIDIDSGSKINEAFREIATMIGDHVQVEHH